MNHTLRPVIGSLSALLAFTFVLSPASALEPDDGARFRGGIMGELGPGVFTNEGHVVMTSGLQGHVGVQLSDTFGLYWGPRFQVLAGAMGGVYTGGPFVLDVTLGDVFAIGLGPELGAYIEVVDGEGTISSPQVGGLVHLAVYPEREGGTRRSGVVIGADLGIRATGQAYAACVGCGPEGPPLLLAPTFFIGHEVY